MTNNISAIVSALQALDDDLKQREEVNTSFGKQSPAHGYEIIRIYFLNERHIRVDITMKDRSIRENDYVRGGDEVSFRILQGQVFSDEDYERLCEETAL